MYISNLMDNALYEIQGNIASVKSDKMSLLVTLQTKKQQRHGMDLLVTFLMSS